MTGTTTARTHSLDELVFFLSGTRSRLNTAYARLEAALDCYDAGSPEIAQASAQLAQQLTFVRMSEDAVLALDPTNRAVLDYRTR